MSLLWPEGDGGVAADHENTDYPNRDRKGPAWDKYCAFFHSLLVILILRKIVGCNLTINHAHRSCSPD